MQRLIYFLAIIMVLTACQPTTATSTTMPTSKVLPSATPTEAATATATTKPTEIPTATHEAVNFEVNSQPEDFRNNPLGTFDFTKPDSVANFDKVMDDYFQWAKEQAQKVQFGPDVKPVVLKEHYAAGLGGMVLYPDNKDAMKAFDFKEFFVTGPDGIAYPERVYTYSLHTADGNIPVILDRSYYEPSFPAKNRVSVNKVNQIIDNNGTPNFKEWVEFYQS